MNKSALRIILVLGLITFGVTNIRAEEWTYSWQPQAAGTYYWDDPNWDKPTALNPGFWSDIEPYLSGLPYVPDKINFPDGYLKQSPDYGSGLVYVKNTPLAIIVGALQGDQVINLGFQGETQDPVRIFTLDMGDANGQHKITINGNGRGIYLDGLIETNNSAGDTWNVDVLGLANLGGSGASFSIASYSSNTFNITGKLDGVASDLFFVSSSFRVSSPGYAVQKLTLENGTKVTFANDVSSQTADIYLGSNVDFAPDPGVEPAGSTLSFESSTSLNTTLDGSGNPLGGILLNVDSTIEVGTGAVVSIGLNIKDPGFRNFLIYNTGGVDSKYSLTKQGVGELILTGHNTYEGGTYLKAGTLTIGQNDALGDGSHPLYQSGGTFKILNDLTFNHNSIISGISTWDTNGHNLVIGDDISISGAGVLHKTGDGVLWLNGGNVYTGGTQLSQGTIVADRQSSLGDLSALLDLSGGTLRMNHAFDLSTRSVLIDGSTSTLDALNYDNTFANSIGGHGTGNLVVKGTGSLRFDGGFDTQGNLSVQNGTVIIGATSQAGSLTVDNAGTVHVNGGGTGDFTAATQTVGQSGTGTLVVDDVDHFTTLTAGDTVTGSGTVTLSAGSSLLGQNEFIGSSGAGVFNQLTNATHTLTGNVVLGDQATGVGTFNLGAGTLNASTLVVGNLGQGTFNQTGGTATFTSATVGGSSLLDNHYTHSGGTLSVSDLIVGQFGQGTYDISNGAALNWTGTTTFGGENNSIGLGSITGATLTGHDLVAGDGGLGGVTQYSGTVGLRNLEVARNFGSTGSYYDVKSGTLQTTNVTVGAGGRGNFYLEGGTMTVDQTLRIGPTNGAKFSMSGGSLTTKDEIVGTQPFASGTFLQTGGTQTNTNSITVEGTYQVNGGTLQGKAITVGNFGQALLSFGGGQGTFDSILLGSNNGAKGTLEIGQGSTVTTDTLTISQNSQLNLKKNGTLNVTTLKGGDTSGASGSFQQLGGNITTGGEQFGITGSGSLQVSGGTHSVTGVAVFGVNENSNGNLTISSTYDLQTFTPVPGTYSASTLVLGEFGTGYLTNIGGTLTADNIVLGRLGGSGVMNLISAGSVTAGNEIIGNHGRGLVSQYGGTNTVTGTLSIGAETRAGASFDDFSNSNYDLGGGTLTADTVVVGDKHAAALNVSGFGFSGGTANVSTLLIKDKGQVNYSGGSLSATTITNSGVLNVGQTNSLFGPPELTEVQVKGALTATTHATTNVGYAYATFKDEVTNYGAFNVHESTVTFEKTFTNHGTYTSDPSTNNFANLVVAADGSLVAGAGDVFNISGDFTNLSTQASTFDLSLAQVNFIGAGNHNLTWSGIDGAGFNSNFVIGKLELGVGVGLTLTGSDAGSHALYIRELILDGGTAQLSLLLGGLTIYYDSTQASNSYLNGENYSFGTGQLIAQVETVPEPSTWCLLAVGLGSLGMIRRKRETT